MDIHRKCIVVVLVWFAGLLATAAGAAPNDLVISQVYGGGGNSGAPYRNDFIEVFNRGAATVNLAGWSVQYATSTGMNWEATELSGQIAPGQYFLVQQAAGATGDGVSLPAPDISDNTPMDANSGKVALVAATAQLSGNCPTSGFIDLVGYGAASCQPTGTALNNLKAALRGDLGCADTGNNSADFAATDPFPRNTSSPLHPCGGIDVPPSIDAPSNPIATVNQNALPFPVQLTGSDDKGAFRWSASAVDGVDDVSVTGGQMMATATFTVTLWAGFSGTATFTAFLSDDVNPPAAVEVNISVTPADPVARVAISQIYGGGGNSGAKYRNDYVELYNRGDAPVDLGEWTVQYASAGGTTWRAQRLRDTIGAHEYYLIALASGGNDGETLPPANIESEGINLSATAGKVALALAADLEGCPLGQAVLVDLVGYGPSATCSEGDATAPAASNTLALFRKDGGSTDTDVNAADFESGVPTPRRTAEIVEHGPFVQSVEPRFFSAPRDASISVTFSEAVEIADGSWIEISCTETGLHVLGNATVAVVDEQRTWIVTPNSGFHAGERCSVIIYGNFVRDVDFDDGNPNSDTMTGNYTWAFSVATGADPPYPSGVHLTMGNPSGASTDLLTPDDYLMEKPEYALSYNRGRGIANWVSWHLDDGWTEGVDRENVFRPDPAVPADWYRVLPNDYGGSGFDKGHVVPSADRKSSRPVNQATFLMTNMLPQAPHNNQGPWAKLESHLRTLLPANELYVVAGGAGAGGTGDDGLMTSLADGRVTVPEKTWKVALVLPKASGDDVLRVNAATKTIAVIMPNIQGIRSDGWEMYLVTVDRVEELTGYDFFANVRDDVENAIEAGTNGVNPPGVADQSVSTDEDTPRLLTLTAISTSPLTYTIVSGPAHGALSGSEASRTYTPVADFNGTDHFTFRVSNSAGNSNIATVTITVLEVNDTPGAADDNMRTSKDRTLQFATSELVSNDRPGPTNESGQILTVMQVTATGDTHGVVTLSSGTVTYVPAAGFTGAARFTYVVCDNGVTRGLTTPLCATGSVNVIVGGSQKRRAVRSLAD